jgi:hypothetical protein
MSKSRAQLALGSELGYEPHTARGGSFTSTGALTAVAHLPSSPGAGGGRARAATRVVAATQKVLCWYCVFCETRFVCNRKHYKLPPQTVSVFPACHDSASQEPRKTSGVPAAPQCLAATACAKPFRVGPCLADPHENARIQHTQSHEE